MMKKSARFRFLWYNIKKYTENRLLYYYISFLTKVKRIFICPKDGKRGTSYV